MKTYIKKIKHENNGWSGYNKKQAFDIEVECYIRLSNKQHFPKLISVNESEYSLETEYCGESLDFLKKRNFDLLNLIDDVDYQLSNIWDTLNDCNIKHLDVQLKNFTLKDGILYLIDYDIAVLDDNLLTPQIKSLFGNKTNHLGRLINDSFEHDSTVYLTSKEYFIFYFKNLLNPNFNTFLQKEPYQIIDQSGGWRNCDDRWQYIEKYITENDESVGLDIGSAEGVFSKKLQNKTNGLVYSIEGSDFPYKRQLKFCNTEIKNEKIILLNFNLDSKNVNFVNNKKYKYTLLLSVLHWIDDPDFVFGELSKVSEYMFVEIPSLDDNVTLNRKYMTYIKNTFGDIETYIKAVSKKEIINKVSVPAHTSKTRDIYIIK